MNPLEAWRLSKGMSYVDIADRLGRKNMRQITQWCKPFNDPDYLKPEPEVQNHIQSMTLGEVSPNAWRDRQIDVSSAKAIGGSDGRKQ
jgi:hypothetical protein